MTDEIHIPQASPVLGYIAHRDEIDAAVAGVLARGRYVLGAETEAFEAEFAAYVGVRFGVGVGSGTDALHLALWACNVGSGDEVITVSHTAVATVAAIRLRGAVPVLVDVDPETLCMDPALVERAVTPRTRVILPVHLYGHSVDLDPILSVARRHGIRVVEDCAQSHGARYKGRRTGAHGDFGCFSFYPTKNLGAIGDGGMLVTDDPALHERVRLLREYGWQRRYVSVIEGTNSRLDELQAAILRVKLRYLDEDNAKRSSHAADYNRLIDAPALRLPTVAAWAEHSFHQYVVRSSQRDELAAFLRKRGVATLVHYPVPVHLQPGYSSSHVNAGGLAVTERAASEVLSLPMYPELTEEQLECVAHAITEWNGF
ncbi:MAG: DegT/DnrJ/EryC1/StrS family aminotransferase [Chloroflexota bacterium]|nr:MAG: DegT/DnrJ/EryC1/StrS family aminotransferase [Chloroflexota bacterium]